MMPVTKKQFFLGDTRKNINTSIIDLRKQSKFQRLFSKGSL